MHEVPLRRKVRTLVICGGCGGEVPRPSKFRAELTQAELTQAELATAEFT